MIPGHIQVQDGIYAEAKEALRRSGCDAISLIAEAIRAPSIGRASLVAARAALDRAYFASLVTDPE